MLTTKDIQQSEKLTEEYGDGRDHGRQYPDPANTFEAMEVRHQRQSLEHSLATNSSHYRKLTSRLSDNGYGLSV